jgi:MHS family proline/betaine transporter-like MFS transporter
MPETPTSEVASAPDQAPVSSRMGWTVLAGMIGNAVEWYDYGLYGYLAPVLATLFFPSKSPLESLMATFGVFAAGFLLRPLGAIAFGHLGDRLGRKKALVISVALMAVPTGLIGLLPTDADVGSTAAVLLVLLRLLQGFSVGGEFTGSIIFLVEHAPPSRRGFIGCWAGFSTNAGCLLGTGVGALLVTVLGRQAVEEWAWRLPFFFGAVLGVVGLFLRLGVEETPRFTALVRSEGVAPVPLLEALRHERRAMATAFSLLWLSSVGFFTVFVYLPGYLSNVAGLPLHSAMLINWLGTIVVGVVIPPVGFLSDRVGRKPPILFAAAALLVLSYPLFWLLALGDFTLCLVAACTFAGLLATLVSPLYALLVELFKTRARYTALSLGFNIATALFGGSAPLLATWLVAQTGDARSPGLYLMLSAGATVLVLWLIRDPYRAPLS